MSNVKGKELNLGFLYIVVTYNIYVCKHVWYMCEKEMGLSEI